MSGIPHKLLQPSATAEGQGYCFCRHGDTEQKLIDIRMIQFRYSGGDAGVVKNARPMFAGAADASRDDSALLAGIPGEQFRHLRRTGLRCLDSRRCELGR